MAPHPAHGVRVCALPASGDFVEYVGGAKYAHHLLTPLESLATVEEMTVRQQAVAALNKVAAALPESAVSEHFVPMLKKLSTRDWFTSRISAAGLFAGMYVVPAPRRCVCSLSLTAAHVFHQLRACGTTGEGRTPVSVRRFVRGRHTHGAPCCLRTTRRVREAGATVSPCQRLPSVCTECLCVRGWVVDMGCAQVEAEHIQSELLGLASSLASDEQDSVRLLAVDNFVVLAGLLPTTVCNANVLPLVLQLADDKSWRVRWSVANKIIALCEAFGAAISRNQLLDSFTALLQDTESEVRTCAALHVTDMAKKVGADATVSKVGFPACPACLVVLGPWFT